MATAKSRLAESLPKRVGAALTVVDPSLVGSTVFDHNRDEAAKTSYMANPLQRVIEAIKAPAVLQNIGKDEYIDGLGKRKNPKTSPVGKPETVSVPILKTESTKPGLLNKWTAQYTAGQPECKTLDLTKDHDPQADVGLPKDHLENFQWIYGIQKDDKAKAIVKHSAAELERQKAMKEDFRPDFSTPKYQVTPSNNFTLYTITMEFEVIKAMLMRQIVGQMS